MFASIVLCSFMASPLAMLILFVVGLSVTVALGRIFPEYRIVWSGTDNPETLAGLRVTGQIWFFIAVMMASVMAAVLRDIVLRLHAECNKAEAASRDVAARDLQERKEQAMARKSRLEAVILAFRTEVLELSENVRGRAQEMASVATTLGEVITGTEDARRSTNVTLEVAAGNVEALASATHQLDHSIAEVTQQSARVVSSLGDANAADARCKSSVKNLDDIVGSITKLVGVISKITEQTNLLALNATIEAARGLVPLP